MSVLIMVGIFLSFPFRGFASDFMRQEAEQLVQQGNEFYQEKKYEDAIDAYQKVVRLGYEGTALYYNLGNAYYRDGKIGLSILYYEKALKLSPHDDDVIHNLTIANSKTIDKVDTLPKFFLFQWWESILALFSVTGWSHIVYIFYLLLLASIGAYFFVRNMNFQRYVVYFGLISTFFLVVSASIWAINLNRSWHVKNAIVIEAVVPVKLSPDSTSGDAFVVHEGLKVREIDTVGRWVNIRLPDGKEGWVLRDELGVI
jgi:tetratricopeptide (TPR) repeat protein